MAAGPFRMKYTYHEVVGDIVGFSTVWRVGGGCERLEGMGKLLLKHEAEGLEHGLDLFFLI